MSGLDIAQSIIEGKEEEIRVLSASLHYSNLRNKTLEKEKQECEKIIQILNDRLRSGSNSALESTLYQKDLMIRHLELQIQKSLKQINELEFQLESLRAEKCQCEKYFNDKKSLPKTNKTGKPGHIDYADRQLRLERMLEHKDKRILHLSNEIKRLKNMVEELTKKTYRYSKLLPMSHKSSEAVNDLLLDEIHNLESQLESFKDTKGKIGCLSDKTNMPVYSADISPEKLVVRKSTAAIGKENINLHSLYDDINDVKHRIMQENEKFQRSLNENSLKCYVMKTEWSTIINKLNDIAEAIQNVNKISLSFQDEKADYNASKDEVILNFQKKLRDALELSAGYQNENLNLQKKVADLTEKILQLEKPAERSATIHTDSNSSNLKKLRGMLDMKKSELDSARNHISSQQNFIVELQSSLQKASSHRSVNSQIGGISYQTKSQQTDSTTNISERQNVPNFNHRSSRAFSDSHFPDGRPFPQQPFHQAYEISSMSSSNISPDSRISPPNYYDKRIKALETKLDISEKQIQKLQSVIENLQSENAFLREKNSQIDTDLYKARSEKTILESTEHINSSLKARLNDLQRECDEIKKQNQSLCDKNEQLKGEKVSLQEQLQACRLEKKSSRSHESSLQTKVSHAENHIERLNKNMTELKNEVLSLKEENIKLKSNRETTSIRSERAVLESTEHINSSLKAKLKDLQKESDEIKKQNQSLSDKNEQLEEENFNLQEQLQACRKEKESSKSHESLLQTKVSHAADHIERLERNVTELTNEVLSLKEENVKLKSDDQSKAYYEVQHRLMEKDNEIYDLKEQLHDLENQALQMNLHRRNFRKELKRLCTLMEESDTNLSSSQSKAIYKAAILRSAKALLLLDMDDNSEESHQNGALEEMKHQLNIWVTEVQRINQLLSAKSQQCHDELLREYLSSDFGDEHISLDHEIGNSNLSSDVPATSAVSGIGSIPVISTTSSEQSVSSASISSREGQILDKSSQTLPVIVTSEKQSLPVISTSSAAGPTLVYSTASGVKKIPAIFTVPGTGSIPSVEHGVYSSSSNIRFNVPQTGGNQSGHGSHSEIVRTLQEEVNRQKTVTTLFISKCASLEQELKERDNAICKCQRDNSGHQELVNELRRQVKEKDKRVHHLEKLLGTMQTNKSNIDINFEQQRSELEWLMNENKQLFEKITTTQTELGKCKEENCKILNEVNLLKRQLVNEKYEYAKVENELKHLREHISHCQSSSSTISGL